MKYGLEVFKEGIVIDDIHKETSSQKSVLSQGKNVTRGIHPKFVY
jgi:hypothetical protein